MVYNLFARTHIYIYTLLDKFPVPQVIEFFFTHAHPSELIMVIMVFVLQDELIDSLLKFSFFPLIIYSNVLHTLNVKNYDIRLLTV